MFDNRSFEENGYSIIRNLFSKEEIKQIRSLVYKQIDEDKQNNLTSKIGNTEAFSCKDDLYCKDKLRPILMDDRIINIAKKALKSEDVVYFRDSSYMVGTGFRGWHRDNIDRTYGVGPDWEGEYSIIRFGLYLQNHRDYSGGLKIQAKSHKQSNGKKIFVDTMEGDLVLWSLRTLHSGNAVRLKMFPNLSLNHLENYIPSFIKKDQQKERISLFMTFGIKSNHLDRYINEYLLTRENTREGIKLSQRKQIQSENKVEVLDFDI